MTISTTDDPRAGPFNGNGSQTAFPFAYKAFTAADQSVVHTDAGSVETTLVLDLDYSVALNADQDANPGGTVTYPISGAPLPTGETLTIVSDLDYTQETDIVNAGGFYPQVIENALDRITMLVKQVNTTVRRALQLAVSTPDGADVTLPPAELGNVIGWGVGDVLVNVPLSTLPERPFQIEPLHVATEGQTTFNLASIVYTAGINSLWVFVNGVLVSDYVETNPTRVDFTEGLSAGDEVRFIAGAPLNSTVVGDASLLTYTPAGAGAVASNAQAKLREWVSVADKGGLADSAGTTGSGTDNRPALLNAAIDAKEVRLGAGIWRFAAEVQFTGPMRIIGEPPAINKDGTLSGTWVYFDHVGRGFYFRDGVSDVNYGAVVENVGILRDQPVAGGGWVPTTCDYDIQTDTSHLTVRNVWPLRSTKFLNVRNAASLSVDVVRGQVFQEGIRLERTADVARIDNVHFWPFWSQDSNVTTYMTDTLKGLVLQRADNPIVSNWFSIYSRHGFYIEETADGNTSKLSGSNIDFDQSDFGISIAAGATVTAKLVNVHHQAPAAGGRTTGNALNVLGDNCCIDAVGLESGRRVEEFVHIGGTANVVTLTNPRSAGAATGGGGETFYTVEGGGAANALYIVGPPGTYTAAYAAVTDPTFTAASPHVVSYDMETDWTPTLTFATPGDVAVTYATRVGKAKRVGKVVTAQFNIVTSAFTHTTASGNLRISGFPFTSANVTGAEAQGNLEWQGITKATYTSVVSVLTENATIMTFRASGSGVGVSNVGSADVPTGGTVRLRGTITYFV